MASVLRPLIKSNIALLSQKIALLDLLVARNGAAQASINFQHICPIVGASIGQHYRHSMDHVELAALVASSTTDTASSEIGELHYDLRVRGGTLEKDIIESRKRIVGVMDIFQYLQNSPIHTKDLVSTPVHSYFNLTADTEEMGLPSMIGRELGFVAHHSIHHLAMVKIIVFSFALPFPTCHLNEMSRPPRPSSAATKRPSSARPTSARRATLTKTFFDLKEGKKNDDEDPPSPFNANENNDERDHTVNEAFLSLLRNSDANDNVLYGWDILRTVKPRVEFADPARLFGFPFVDRCLDGYFGGGGDRYANVEKGTGSQVLVPPNEAITQGIVKYFWNFLVCTIRGGIMAVKGIRAKNRSQTNENSAVDSEEDGLFVFTADRGQQSSGSGMARMDERIRREMPAAESAKPVQQVEALENDIRTIKPKTEKVNQAEESFWASPGQQKKYERRHKPVIEVTVNVEEIKFQQHPFFTEEESILSLFNNLYERYRERIEADSLHYFIKRLTGIIQYIQSDCDNMNNEVSSANLLELTSTAEKLAEESNSIKNLHCSLAKLSEELCQAREKSGFVCTDTEVKIEDTSNAEFEENIQRLMDSILELRSNLSETSEHQKNATRALDAVDRMLHGDTKHCKQIMNMVKANNVQQLSWIPKDEKARRKRISSERYFARLLINGHPVGDTKAVKLEWPSFAVRLSHRFHCRLSEPPDNACVQLFMSPTGFLPAHFVCSVFVGVPYSDIAASATRDNIFSVPSSDWYSFAAAQTGLKGSLFISTSLEAIRAESSHMTMVPQQLTSVPSSSRKMIRRPLNVREVLVHANRGSSSDRQLMMAFKLGNSTLLSSFFEEPSRHVIIKNRQFNRSVTSPIPNCTSDMVCWSESNYSSFLNRDTGHGHEDIIETALRERSVVNKQNATSFFKAVIEDSILKDRRRMKKKSNYSEIIQDVGDFRFLDELELPCLPRKRSLYPASLRRMPTKSSFNQYSLLFSIVMGRNLPTRSLEESSDELDEVHLGLVVRLQLRDKSFYTRAVAGSATPFWNETIAIPLDFIVDELGNTAYSLLENELVEVSIFDCIDTDMKKRGGFYDDEDTKLLDYLYVGSVAVPLSTVLKHESIDGFVRLSTPSRIIGYSKSPGSSPLGADDNEDPTHLSGKAELMLRIFATTDPMIPFPAKARPEYPSNEHQHVLTRVNQWSGLFLNYHSDTSSILWPDINGISYLVTRFMVEQNPPNRFKTPESCAHYCSMIPNLDSWKSLEKLNMDRNSVLSTQQTINILAGNAREKAVLLANFFLYLSKNAEYNADVYLVLGSAIPEGDTVWVMRKCKRFSSDRFWDATSGCAYACEDDTSPLQRIYCLVSKENVYANLQREKKTSSLDFDVKNSRKWAPLHVAGANGQQPLGLMTIQDEVLNYTQPTHGYAKELQDELKEAIKCSMRSWRRTTTSFRTDLVSKLASVLTRLEESKMTGKEADMALLDDLSKTRYVFGFPLHFPFTNVEDALDRIKATQIHQNQNPNVEFSLAVRVFAYPGCVMSVWVFVASLVPK